MKTIVSTLILLASISLLRADPAIKSAQQALKDQGFYYGEITGAKNADTTAAIRRYQIRNGLPVTGELDGETLRALGVGDSSQPSVAKASPSAAPDTARQQPQPQEETAEAGPAPAEPSSTQPADRDVVYPSRPAAIAATRDPPFTGTPYASAPLEVQRNVVISAQRSLARRGLYRGDIDGICGPNMEFSLRAYQARVKLPVTGRLDLETLAALQLLPGAHAPVYIPRRRIFREPPVRGEWIPE
jgi:peptidoglycan hydrolase-like protein with peptidoglycan-binding domain